MGARQPLALIGGAFEAYSTGDDARFNSLGVGAAASGTAGGITSVQAAAASGTPTAALSITGGAHTGLANAQATDIDLALARAVAFSGGGAAITWQSAVRVQGPTYSAAAAQTIAELSTLLIEQPLTTGVNLTATRTSALTLNGVSAAVMRWYTGSLTAAPTRTAYISLDNASGNLDFSGAMSFSSSNDITMVSSIIALLTLTRSASSGAVGALGPELLQFETREAATAGGTIRNPGYLAFEARTWKTLPVEAPSSTIQSFGRFGGVIDSITDTTGVPATYRLVWANTAGTIKWSVDEAGLTRANSGDFTTALSIGNVAPSATAGRLSIKGGGGGTDALIEAVDATGANGFTIQPRVTASGGGTGVNIIGGAANTTGVGGGVNLRAGAGAGGGAEGSINIQKSDGATQYMSFAVAGSDNNINLGPSVTQLSLNAAYLTGGTATASDAARTESVTGTPGILVREVVSKITEAFFTAAATSETKAFLTIPARAVIDDIWVEHTANFTGGTLTAFTIEVGRTGGATTDFYAATDVFAGAPKLLGDAAAEKATALTDGRTLVFSTSATTELTVTARSTGDNVVAATAGRVNIWVRYHVVPAAPA